MLWLIPTLLTAFSQAMKEAFVKQNVKDVNPHVLAFSWWFLAVPFISLTLFITGIPEITLGFYTALVISGSLNAIASTLLVLGLQASDISLTVPMLSFTPVFLLLTAPIVLGEFPTLLGVVGILLIVTGSYVLNIHKKEKGILAPFKAIWHEKGPRYVLGAAAIYSITAVFDKVGVQNSSPMFWGVSLSAFVALLLFLYVLGRNRKELPHFKQHFPSLLLLGFFFGCVILFHMTAIMLTQVAYVIAVKRLSILMGVVIGAFIFKEHGFKARLTGAGIMVAGAALIALA